MTFIPDNAVKTGEDVKTDESLRVDSTTNETKGKLTFGVRVTDQTAVALSMSEANHLIVEEANSEIWLDILTELKGINFQLQQLTEITCDGRDT